MCVWFSFALQFSQISIFEKNTLQNIYFNTKRVKFSPPLKRLMLCHSPTTSCPCWLACFAKGTSEINMHNRFPENKAVSHVFSLSCISCTISQGGRNCAHPFIGFFPDNNQLHASLNAWGVQQKRLLRWNYQGGKAGKLRTGTRTSLS